MNWKRWDELKVKKQLTKAEQVEWRAMCKEQSEHINDTAFWQARAIGTSAAAQAAPVAPTIPTRQRIVYQDGLPVIVTVPDCEAIANASLAKMHTRQVQDSTPEPGSALEWSRNHTNAYR